ncbi:aldose 1-epimerase [Sphingomonas lutea]|uniref:Aldose 1-epimerase n=1 Tax=Sphingomonas lutea TaxID=1045317 RepID=A0A7G9SJ50_9SPHN|nr:aldose 1-epimerase [Sphingomonas lutea]QNN67875.1 aldose 1-epimerase [Sphingomonas lutea]
MTLDAVRLEAGALRLELAPEIGASIQHFSWHAGEQRVHILRNGDRAGGVLDASSFPLVPFVNRIRGGRFTFRDREVVLAPNMTGDPSPLHGQGWLRPWSVDRVDGSRAVLSFHHEAAEWPWTYAAEQAFSLDGEGLSIRLTCRNLDTAPMPCGLGQHPYFPCGAQTRLATKVTSVWTIDADVLPVANVPADGAFDLADRRVCGQGLDHGFGGWGGEVALRDPAWPCDLRLSSPDARFFQLYSPVEGGIFVAEPVTHANAALNAPEAEWAELGLEVLEPGETMHLDMRLDVVPK